ncbi:MAG: DUF1446 domain-containing protein [Actinomycetota bacterium]|nr:DUF1446 domain-containing protein [Actinomycetota bacterium]
MSEPLRIANVSGFYGDRLSAMREQLEGGPIDVLTGDYLAELTMLILGRDQLKDASRGYARTFLRQVADCLSLAHERGVRIVSNAGGLNPQGLADALRKVIAEAGLPMTVAYVDGDDLRSRAAEFGVEGILTANAYLGAFGIAEALKRGADIVVTGRVTDASVTMGPAIAHHGWGRQDYDALAGALIAGHVIECGAQATGGNFTGFAALSDLLHPGFPIAEIAVDGSSVITKHRGSAGAVTVDTVTAQLVYEIGAPTYLNPDVVGHLDTVRLTQTSLDRVQIDGVRGTPPPPTTKVCLNRLGGFRNVVEFVLTGLEIPAKAALVRAQMEHALALDQPAEVTWRLDDLTVPDPETQVAATALLTCQVLDRTDRPVGRAFSAAAVELALASYPGFTMTRPPSSATAYGIYSAAYVAQGSVPHRVTMQDGEVIEIDPPQVTEQPILDVVTPVAASFVASDSVRAPLGVVAHARSGDKGGDANVGVWIPSAHLHPDAAYEWLQALLTPDDVRRLLPEAADLDIDVWPLPHLRAVNVVIHGLLGEGVAASTRLDPQAKALGEWLRARVVDIPKEFI